MRRQGTVLVAVLAVTALASMVAAGVLYRLRADLSAAGAARSGHQAYTAALAGIQRAMAVLQAGSADPALWYDRPELFQNQLVLEDGSQRWYFTLYAPHSEDPTTVRYGLVDEAGKLNLNTASQQMLAGLPNLTDEMVDCLLDYLDRDDDTRSQGAEQDYYSSLPLPYLIKNGPLATLEELLLVKGFSGSAVYGEDHNLNGLLETNENDGDDSFPPDNRDGELDTGLMGLATVISYELNVDANGQSRININGGQEELNRLNGSGLPRETADFIRQYRQEGNTFKHPSELLGMQYQTQQGQGGSPGPGGRRGPRGPGGGTQPGIISSAVTAENLSVVMDKLSTLPGGLKVPGLINVNTASARVLWLVPGVGEHLAERIVQARAATEASERTTTAWLVSQNVVDSEEFKNMAPYLTARSFQFRARCVGFAVPSGRFYILEALIDLSGGQPRVVYTRDLTRLGLPVAVDAEHLAGGT